jgi:hypothetical protein
MSVFGVAERLRSSSLQAWTLAFTAFALSLAARFVFDEVLPAGFPYLTFFPAVILTAFFAGLWPGIVCAALCGLSAWYWFIPPFESFHVNLSGSIALLFYVCIVSVDILLIHLMHAATEGLRAERAVTRELYDQRREESGFELAWSETGGPAVTTPTRRGFGSRLIERVVPSYFQGTTSVDYHSEGVRVTLAGMVEPHQG